MSNYYSNSELSRLLEAHLHSWGLKRFQDEAAYYQWQKDALSASDISSLQQLARYRQTPGDSSADIRFYDLAATPAILPVLYSQRYDFFHAAGIAISSRLSSVERVLDFGCGVGILTTFWATMFPNITFVGIDRSSQSITMASQQALQRQLNNVLFECCQVPDEDMTGEFDCLVSTQALFQSEHSPGLCSADWSTFSRIQDSTLQERSESQTGIKERLDSLSRVLTPDGKLLLCEKVQHLGRRILLQRALASRGFNNISEPQCLTYNSFGEYVNDGPLYEVSRRSVEQEFPWDEEPDWNVGQSLYACSGIAGEHLCLALGIFRKAFSTVVEQHEKVGACTLQTGTWRTVIAYGYVSIANEFQGILLGSIRDGSMIAQSWARLKNMTEQEIKASIPEIWRTQEIKNQKHIPCYENHTLGAQYVWESLPDRSVTEEKTFREHNGRAMHIELGIAGPFTYVYRANTYDQRQLVMVDSHHAEWLVEFYRESLSDMQNAATL